MEKKKIIMMLCIALLVMTVGYAALSRVININGTAEITSTWNLQFISISATGQTDGATEINTPSASGTTATFHVGLKAPGDEITYLITLKNLGSINAVISEITASELGNDAIKFEVTDIAKGDKIAGQTEKVFKVKISFDSSVTEQPSLNDNKIELTIKCVQDLSQTITPGELEISKTRLSAKILSDNIPRSDADIDFSVSSDVDGTNGLYYTSTNTENNRTTYYFRGAVDNNYVKFGTQKACTYNGQRVVVLNEYGAVYYPSEEECINSTVCIFEYTEEVFGTKYIAGISEENCTNNVFGAGIWTGETGMYGQQVSYTCKYNNDNVGYVVFDEMMNPTLYENPNEEECKITPVCDAGTLIKDNYNLDYRYVVGVDATTCGAMGGTFTANDATYEEFREELLNDIYWRIVRINEDGSIRMILDDQIGRGGFNSEYDDNAYVGYMYGTPGSDNYEDTHANENDSEIKLMLDNWYVNHLSSFSSYLTDAGFCSDRSVAHSPGVWANDVYGYDTALGYGTNETYYGAYNRLFNLYKPQFKCPNASHDLFTLSTSTKGNKALTYPIGLITADEVAYAGSGPNTEMYIRRYFYLNDIPGFWTMTPEVSNYQANVYYVATMGYLIGEMNTESLIARPVINLRADVEIISGDGTVGNEYIIKTN